MAEPVLWQYNFSNFNEKVRWALDHKGIAHRRRSLVPGFPRAMWFSMRGTLPVLDLDGERIVDTTTIIAALERAHPEQPLYPDDPDELAQALELEEFFDENAGHDMRRALFWSVKDNHDYVARLVTIEKPAPVRWFMRASLPVGWQYIKRRYSFDEVEAARSAERLRTALDRIESERGGGDYLVGESFSVADLTAAALLFAVAMPAELQYEYPPAPPVEPIDAVADHPATGWIREIYRRHRGRSAAVA